MLLLFQIKKCFLKNPLKLIFQSMMKETLFNRMGYVHVGLVGVIKYGSPHQRKQRHSLKWQLWSLPISCFFG